MTTEFKMRTMTTTLSSEAKVRSLCGKLITASQWFSVLPLPNDRWEVEVKSENDAHLQTWLSQIERENQYKA